MRTPSRVAALRSRGGTSLASHAGVDPNRTCPVCHSPIDSLVVLRGRSSGCTPSARSRTPWDRDATARSWPDPAAQPPARKLSSNPLGRGVSGRCRSRTRPTYSGHQPSSVKGSFLVNQPATLMAAAWPLTPEGGTRAGLGVDGDAGCVLMHPAIQHSLLGTAGGDTAALLVGSRQPQETVGGISATGRDIEISPAVECWGLSSAQRSCR
jgi:hypothetical protein